MFTLLLRSSHYIDLFKRESVSVGKPRGRPFRKLRRPPLPGEPGKTGFGAVGPKVVQVISRKFRMRLTCRGLHGFELCLGHVMRRLVHGDLMLVRVFDTCDSYRMPAGRFP